MIIIKTQELSGASSSMDVCHNDSLDNRDDDNKYNGGYQHNKDNNGNIMVRLIIDSRDENDKRRQ